MNNVLTSLALALAVASSTVALTVVVAVFPAITVGAVLFLAIWCVAYVAVRDWRGVE